MKRGYVDIPEGQIHYQYEGSGEPLMLLHQGMFSSDEFVKVVPFLSKKYRCIARDMLGYGMSDVNPPDFTIEQYARADINFMKALGVKKASFVGVHTGGSLAVEIAATHPEMVDKIVAYGFPTFAPGVREACIKSYTFSPVQIKEDGSHFTERLWKITRKLGARAKPEDWNIIVIAAAMAKGGAFHGEHSIFRYDEQKRLPLVKSPTLIISGTEDVFHARLEELKGKIARSKTLVIPEVDGFVTMEKPEEFARAVLDFLGNPGV